MTGNTKINISQEFVGTNDVMIKNQNCGLPKLYPFKEGIESSNAITNRSISNLYLLYYYLNLQKA